MDTRTQKPGPRRGRSRIWITLLAFVTTLCVGLVASVPAQAAPPEPSALSGKVTGTLQDGTGKVAGLLNVIKFKKRDGKLYAVGKFTGTITNAAGDVTKVSKKITMPLATEPVAGAQKPSAADKKAGVSNQLSSQTEKQLAPNAAPAAAALSCQILDLVLGPLDLNLLGLKVHLDKVHLNITAQGGPGNLLGNLLCAVAGLLDGSTGLNGILNGIVSLLNRLLGVLG
ncbi:MAG TPA: hypothetical protein VFP34_05100 [Microlunatus sp.]|nr:hypothetical protein [Microlunatus sp.]